MKNLAVSLMAFILSGPLFADTEPPLTNADVVKIAGMHLGDDVLIAKINQAPAVNFDLSGQGLSNLQRGGVSSPVIAAMLKRTTPATTSSNQAGVPPELAQARVSAAIAMATGQHQRGVRLRTKDGEVELSGRQGEYQVKFVVFAYLGFWNYNGVASKSRTTDRRPELLATLAFDPHDVQESSYSFLVKLDPSKRGDIRSLKVGKGMMGGARPNAIPDRDWTVDYNAVQDSPGFWRITPKRDLEPGEYGLYSGGLLYDFAVDK